MQKTYSIDDIIHYSDRYHTDYYFEVTRGAGYHKKIPPAMMLAGDPLSRGAAETRTRRDEVVAACELAV